MFIYRSRMQKKSFTLIEMLIVVVIIGILAAALIPRLQSVQARARDIKRIADIHQIWTALEEYKMDHGNNFKDMFDAILQIDNQINAPMRYACLEWSWIASRLDSYLTSTPSDHSSTWAIGWAYGWDVGNTLISWYGLFPYEIKFRLILAAKTETLSMGNRVTAQTPESVGTQWWRQDGSTNGNIQYAWSLWDLENPNDIKMRQDNLCTITVASWVVDNDGRGNCTALQSDDNTRYLYFP